MKYRCMTPGCAKFGVVYTRPGYDGSESLDCTLCGEVCDAPGDPTPAPETTSEPSESESGYDQGFTLVPLTALDQLITLYRHYYNLDRGKAIDKVREDTWSVRG